MGRWKGKGRRQIEESVKYIYIYIYIFFKVNVKKNYRKIGNKKEIYIYIYIDVKTDKNEYVKLIIYLYFFCKKKGIKKNNNYVANDVAMRWRNRSSTAINATLHLLVIYKYRYRWD